MHSPYKSIHSVGKIEYKAHPHKIKLYRRNPQNESCADCIATIDRRPRNGWRFNRTDKWNEHGLPHFGQLHNIRSHYRGKKTISTHLKEVLDEWGVRYEDITEYKG